MLLPALSHAKGKAKSIQCLNNLKQIGVATLNYAHDSSGQVPINVPLDATLTWASLLVTNQNLKPLEVLLCPSYPPLRFTNWFRTFGVRLDPPTNCIKGSFGEFLQVEAVASPVDYLHLADTTSRGRQGIGSQQFYCFRAALGPRAQVQLKRRVGGHFNRFEARDTLGPQGHFELAREGHVALVRVEVEAHLRARRSALDQRVPVLARDPFEPVGVERDVEREALVGDLIERYGGGRAHGRRVP